ncbi:MAG: serine hydrolase domain-containing protein, partial [Tepidiformaceae bacterium]
MNPYQPLPPEVAAIARSEMERRTVPGLAVAVLHDGAVYAEGFGVTNIEHPLPVDADTLFQIGSTSKTFTATALMQLVEEGLLELDAKVRDYLPTFELQSDEDAERLTVRHLVSHHGGFVGDYFRDTGRGDDALGKIVAKMANSPQLLPAGTAFSYSNAGFYVLGQIIATLRGIPFESVIRERIFEPLGMAHSTYFAEEAIVHAVAAGHIV